MAAAVLVITAGAAAASNSASLASANPPLGHVGRYRSTPLTADR
jgi:hypothetical protein